MNKCKFPLWVGGYPTQVLCTCDEPTEEEYCDECLKTIKTFFTGDGFDIKKIYGVNTYEDESDDSPLPAEPR